jgi:hypothetical protein
MAIIKCPECGHQISDKAPVCPSCGVEIAGNIVRCHRCGEVYFKELQMCPNCHELNPIGRASTIAIPGIPPVKSEENVQQAEKKSLEELSSTSQQPKPKKHVKQFVISFIIACVVCGICFYFYSHAKSEKEEEAYEYALKSTDPLVLQGYLDTYTDASTEHRDSIESILDQLKQADLDWTNTCVSGSKAAFEEYLEQHPNSPHKAEAMSKIDSLDWEATKRTHSADAFNAYLKEHPDGHYSVDASDSLKVINSTIVQPQEKQMISTILRHLYQSINSKDEDGLTEVFAPIQASFLGKSNATYNDVISFMNKIYKQDITNMNWHLPGDYQIQKRTTGDGRYEYSVTYSATQKVQHKDGTVTNAQYRVHTKINADSKISEMDMTKILE